MYGKLINGPLAGQHLAELLDPPRSVELVHALHPDDQYLELFREGEEPPVSRWIARGYRLVGVDRVLAGHRRGGHYKVALYSYAPELDQAA